MSLKMGIGKNRISSTMIWGLPMGGAAEHQDQSHADIDDCVIGDGWDGAQLKLEWCLPLLLKLDLCSVSLSDDSRFGKVNEAFDITVMREVVRLMPDLSLLA